MPVIELEATELHDLAYAPERYEDREPCRIEIEIQQAMLEWPDNFFTLAESEVLS